MSTELLDIETVHLVRFWGGSRGVCYQITEGRSGKYIQLTTPELTEILKALAKSGVDIGWEWRNQ